MYLMFHSQSKGNVCIQPRVLQTNQNRSFGETKNILRYTTLHQRGEIGTIYK